MKRFQVLLPLTLTTVIICSGCSRATLLGGDPPPAPAGYRWQAIPELSDEFNGPALDSAKWLPHHHGWLGRPPSRYGTNNVLQQDGELLLRSTALVSDLSQVKDPEKDIWVQAACVTSVRPVAGYGYYAARLKASQLPMTSSFWFQGEVSEIDVVEQMGASPKHPEEERQMLMNTHYSLDHWRTHKSTPMRWEMPTASADEFHVYGVWWKDKNTVWFYHNGEKVAEARTGGDFLEPMNLFFDTEAFAVREGLPPLAALKDPARNTMAVDWVRSWRLVKSAE